MRQLIEQDKEAIEGFLKKCVEYADLSIQRKMERGDPEAEISGWKSYREFTAYSISELKSGKLDDWLEGEGAEALPHGSACLQTGYSKEDFSEMQHTRRVDLLGSNMGPRPVFLVGTESPAGVQNLAPMSSISVLSNSPPLISMSVSQNRGGRVRDTLLNIREGGVGCKVSIHCLRGDIANARDVNDAAKDVPRDVSEWSLVSGSPISDPSGDLLSTAIATISAEVVELRQLPDSSKAFLVIMRANSIFAIPDSDKPMSRLVQVGNGVLSGSPSGSNWKFNLDW